MNRYYRVLLFIFFVTILIYTSNQFILSKYKTESQEEVIKKISQRLDYNKSTLISFDENLSTIKFETTYILSLGKGLMNIDFNASIPSDYVYSKKSPINSYCIIGGNTYPLKSVEESIDDINHPDLYKRYTVFEDKVKILSNQEYKITFCNEYNASEFKLNDNAYSLITQSSLLLIDLSDGLKFSIDGYKQKAILLSKEKQTIGFPYNDYLFRVYSFSDSWCPNIRSQESKFDKKTNSIFINLKEDKDNRFINVQFDKVGWKEISNWEHWIILKENGIISQKYSYSAISKYKDLSFSFKYFQNVGSNLDIEFILDDGTVKKPIPFPSDEKLVESRISKDEFFGYFYDANYTQIKISAKHPDLNDSRFTINIYSDYSIYESELEDYSFRIPYDKPVYFRSEPNASLKLYFQINNNYYFEDYNYTPINGPKIGPILIYEFKSKDGPFDNLKVVIALQMKRILYFTIFSNLVLGLIFLIFYWRRYERCLEIMTISVSVLASLYIAIYLSYNNYISLPILFVDGGFYIFCLFCYIYFLIYFYRRFVQEPLINDNILKK